MREKFKKPDAIHHNGTVSVCSGSSLTDTRILSAISLSVPLPIVQNRFAYS